jgi:hypothetical protein
MLCFAAASVSAHTTAFTYQGRLTDAAMSANSTYDFGASAFSGADWYLGIRVKRPADAAYTTLLPQQQVTSTPYAIRARSAAMPDTATTATLRSNNLFGGYRLLYSVMH